MMAFRRERREDWDLSLCPAYGRSPERNSGNLLPALPGKGTMPKLIEITPANLRCVPCSCPAVYKLDDGDLVIIGKQLDAELLSEVSGKVGHDEYAVRISNAYFPGSGAGGVN